MIPAFTLHPTVSYLAFISIIFLWIAPNVKKLARKGSRLSRMDFYQGIPMVLATLSSEAAFLLDLVKRKDGTVAEGVTRTVVFVGLTIAALLLIVQWHQDWDPEGTGNDRGKSIRLIVASYLLGGFLMMGFMLIAKSV